MFSSSGGLFHHHTPTKKSSQRGQIAPEIIGLILVPPA
jgi:hypothetical protein